MNCEFNINECDPNPCRNGGTCFDLVNQFQCSCPAGTSGQLCEINVDDCLENPCQHGGTCVDKVILVNLIVGIREIDIKMKISKKISFLQYIFLFYFNMSFNPIFLGSMIANKLASLLFK